MGKEWQPSSLGDHIEMLLGLAFKSKQFRESPPGVRLVRGDNVTEGETRWGEKTRYWPVLSEGLQRYLLRAGDVVVGMDGSKVGRNWAQISDDDVPCLLVQRVACLRSRETLDQGFLAALISSQSFKNHVDAVRTGSSIPHISGKQIADFQFLLPTLREQQSIGRILGALNDKIELNRQMNKTLEAMAQAIFKSWFVDFDPVQVKVEGRQPFGMDTETADLFPDSFRDSPLGEVPTGWKVAAFSEIVDINLSYPLKKGQEASYLDMQNVPTRGHRPTGWITRPFAGGSRFSNGDTLVARITPCLENGKTAFVDFLRDGEVGAGSTEFIVLRPKAPFPPEYGYCLARDESFRAHAIQSMTGSSGRQRVPTDFLDRFLAAIAPEPIARCFGNVVRPLFAMIKINSEESWTLVSIRDLLLPKLISGEIRLGDVEEITKSVVVSEELTPIPKHEANDEFKEAALIAALVRALASPQYPLGRKRYNKFAYLVHRKAEQDVQNRFLKKAAGPYSPWMRYHGPEGIAIKNRYVRTVSIGKLSGLVTSDKIGEIDSYLPKYGFPDSLEWVVNCFRYHTNDALELLTTVDFAALELMQREEPANATNVLEWIGAEPNWAPKLKRDLFSEANIGKALKELSGCFPSDYREAST